MKKRKKKLKKRKLIGSIFWIVIFLWLFAFGLLQLLGVLSYEPHWAVLPPVWKMGLAFGVICRETISLINIIRKSR